MIRLIFCALWLGVCAGQARAAPLVEIATLPPGISVDVDIGTAVGHAPEAIPRPAAKVEVAVGGGCGCHAAVRERRVEKEKCRCRHVRRRHC